MKKQTGFRSFDENANGTLNMEELLNPNPNPNLNPNPHPNLEYGGTL